MIVLKIQKAIKTPESFDGLLYHRLIARKIHLRVYIPSSRTLVSCGKLIVSYRKTQLFLTDVEHTFHRLVRESSLKMPRDAIITRNKILNAASDLLAEQSLTDFSMDKIGEVAGLTKKTLYYHFPTKADLITATAEHMREDYLTKCRNWFDLTSENQSFRQRALIATQEFVEHAKQPSWKGCCFVRITAELAHQTSHPAHEIVRGARRAMEKWFDGMIARDGHRNSASAARQMVVFVNGMVLMMLQDRSGSGGSEAIELVSTILA